MKHEEEIRGEIERLKEYDPFIKELQDPERYEAYVEGWICGLEWVLGKSDRLDLTKFAGVSILAVAAWFIFMIAMWGVMHG